MTSDPKSKTLFAIAPRNEVWLVYCGAYTFISLIVLWNLGDRVDDPLVRLILAGQLLLFYLVSIVLVRVFYDKAGKWIRVAPVRPAAPPEDADSV